MKVTINFEILCCTVNEIKHSTGTQPMCNQLEHSHSNVPSVCSAHFFNVSIAYKRAFQSKKDHLGTSKLVGRACY